MAKGLGFEPCDKNCPALTGKPYGSVRFCPMQDPTRHRKGDKQTVGARRVGDGWEVWDWRVSKWRPAQVTKGKLVHDVPDGPDYTDCCSNFQCCE